MNWFYSENNEQRGPVTEEQLQQMLASGRIKSTTLVWRKGLPSWIPANSCPEFSQSQSPEAAPVFYNPSAQPAPQPMPVHAQAGQAPGAPQGQSPWSASDASELGSLVSQSMQTRKRSIESEAAAIMDEKWQARKQELREQDRLRDLSRVGANRLPADPGPRIGCYFLDGIMFTISLGIFISILIGVGTMLKISSDVGVWLIILWIYVAWTVYFPFAESSSWQGTAGKKILHIKVVNGNGERISFWRACWRNHVKFFCCIGFLKVVNLIVFLCNNEKKAIHDYLAGTSVI